ncbi:MAG: c-type cytochrome biogenesis protein CcsB [Nitrospirae bacterium GWC2_57_13]|nr:MAG: c-type cytochrome biogenesis protein CcsB [Nitrospirae bacterium GWC2_57_13]HAR46053.1 c-type cytochrome biogenesis protein CcsB [Nitrospiraceae bacterium]HAS52714.1 c-type cytochrome biogenesis protein CcsB [Nitrospiraceae bacterium]
MNIQFFQAAMVVYLLAAAGYIAYIIAPEKKNRAVFSLVATVAGFLLHTAYFILRWSESSRIPITGFFEAINFLGMGIVLVFLIMEARYRIAALGSFMLPLVVLLMVPALAVSGKIVDLNPVLKSGWLGIHTSLAVLGDSAFAFACIISVMYLIQERQLKKKHLGAIFHRLPSLEIMDTIGYKAISFGWPLFTLGMVTGSIWAEIAWGTYWSWDPKETWSLITWVIYLAILHLRTLGWRGKKMAYLTIAGFLFVLVSFFVVSRIQLGKHVF